MAKKKDRISLTFDNPEEFMAELKSIKLPVVNDKLKKSLKAMVNDVFRKDLRTSAMKLLMLASKKRIQEFLYYYHSDSGNVCCLVLDAIADDLSKEGKMPDGIGNDFGMSGWDDRQKE